MRVNYDHRMDGNMLDRIVLHIVLVQGINFTVLAIVVIVGDVATAHFYMFFTMYQILCICQPLTLK